MSRDEEQARKFAIEWSTKSEGKIANLAGCYLRAIAARDEYMRQLEVMRNERDNWRSQAEDYAKAFGELAGFRPPKETP